MIRAGEWTGWYPTQLLGMHLDGKAARDRRHGPNRPGGRPPRPCVRDGHPLPQPPPADRRRGGRCGLTTTRSNSLLGVSDVLSLHCPATPETRHLINQRSIERLPPRAIVVNTGRGAVVDDDALIAALNSGRLRAAGLDVFEKRAEPRPAVPPTSECLPAAAPGQRHGRDPQRHGIQGARQSRCLFRREGPARPGGLIGARPAETPQGGKSCRGP